MTPDQKAVFLTLLRSLKEGINATLTPNDCRIVLEMLRDTTVVRNARSKRPPPLIERFQHTASLVMDTIEELAGDIEEIRSEMKK